MYAFAILVLAILALGAAKNLPTLAVLGIVSLLALLLRRQAETAAQRMLAIGKPQNPWATPDRDTRLVMRRALKIAIARTELTSCFPTRGI